MSDRDDGDNIICEELLNPSHSSSIYSPVTAAFDHISNVEPADAPDPATKLTLVPTIIALAHTHRVFDTKKYIIHRLSEYTRYIIDASRDAPTLFEDSVGSFIAQNDSNRIELNEGKLAETFDSFSRCRFGMTDAEYRDWLNRQEITRHTTTVEYTGGCHVPTIVNTGELTSSDVDILEFDPLYVPRITATTTIGSQLYELEWFQAGQHIEITKDTVRECRVCRDCGPYQGLTDLVGLTGWIRKIVRTELAFCWNCSRVVCQAHIRTEQVSGELVCSGCSTTGRFLGARKHFFNDDAKIEYEHEFHTRGLARKLRENIAGIVILVLLALTSFGLFIVF